MRMLANEVSCIPIVNSNTSLYLNEILIANLIQLYHEEMVPIA